MNNEDLMRAFVARLGQLLEVIAVNIFVTPIVALLLMFSVYLAAVVDTPTSRIFAPYLVASSIGLAAKGAVLLHRKWGEYDRAEYNSERKGPQSPWHNPSLDVSGQSKLAIFIANFASVLALALPVLIYCAGVTLSNRVHFSIALIIALASAWAWISASR